MLLRGVVMTVCAISDFWESDDLDVITGMIRDVKMVGDGFFSVLLYALHLFSETLPESALSIYLM